MTVKQTRTTCQGLHQTLRSCYFKHYITHPPRNIHYPVEVSLLYQNNTQELTINVSDHIRQAQAMKLCKYKVSGHVVAIPREKLHTLPSLLPWISQKTPLGASDKNLT